MCLQNIRLFHPLNPLFLNPLPLSLGKMRLLSAIVAAATGYLGFSAYIRKAKLPSVCFQSFEETCLRAGYQVQTHFVTTRDGYILRLFRVQKPGSAMQTGKPPVLMVHGLTHTALAYVVCEGAKPPAFQLADTDFDVWVASTRGSHLSKMHVSLDTASKEFWDFSAQDMAEKDLPALIDFVLTNSGAKTLKYVGHSQGTFLLMHLLSYVPQYNDKVDIGVLLTPFSGTFSPKAKYLNLFLHPWMHKYLEYKQAYSIMTDPNSASISKFLVRFPDLAVRLTKDRYDITLANDSKAVIPIYTQRLIGGTSTKNMVYWSQVVAGKNPRPRKFDYGPERNQVEYGAAVPPELDYSKIRVPLAILGGAHDTIVSQEETNILRMQLTKEQVVFYKSDYNLDHFGFVCSKDMSYMSDVIKLLQTQRPS